jgi:hypothetical protein
MRWLVGFFTCHPDRRGFGCGTGAPDDALQNGLRAQLKASYARSGLSGLSVSEWFSTRFFPRETDAQSACRNARGTGMRRFRDWDEKSGGISANSRR